MIENIKVDIIYFMTATDFEFEFNLGGCCRMRLLNDKVKDKKSFVNSLARAVSRSQVIISVGPLFGEDGLISIAAAAISHSLSTVDNKAYGIASDDKIDIIEGAVPLVTPEGYFGGCIIESGNQSIVVLTENRTVRKSIMKTLVHPYIEDMCIMQSTARSDRAQMPEAVHAAPVSPEAEPVEGSVPEEEPQTPEAAVPAEENSPEISGEAPLGDSIKQAATEETKPAEPIEHNIKFEFFDSKEDSAESADEISDETEQNLKNTFLMSEEDGVKSEAKKGKGINIAILVICILLLLAVFAIFYFMVFLPIVGGRMPAEYFKEIFNTVSKV